MNEQLPNLNPPTSEVAADAAKLQAVAADAAKLQAVAADAAKLQAVAAKLQADLQQQEHSIPRVVSWLTSHGAEGTGEVLGETPGGRLIVAQDTGMQVGQIVHISQEIVDAKTKADEAKAKSKLGAVVALAVAFIMLLLASTGCAGTEANTPSKLSKALLSITATNWVQATNVVTATNYVPVTNYTTVTNLVTGLVTITQTNTVDVPHPVLQTNVVEVPQYTYAPSTTITSGASTVGALTGPWGTVGTGALALILGTYAQYKNKQLGTMTAVAQNSTQAIEVAKATLAALPNGAALSTQFNSWLTAHQQDADIAKELAGVVDSLMPNHSTQAIASGIVAQLATPLKV